MLPLNAEGLPPVIEGNHKLLGLGEHTAIVEDHVDAVLGPPGVGVHGVALEGHCGEVHSRPCGGALLGLLTRGVSTSMTSSPIVLASAFFVAVAAALFFLPFAIVGG